VHGRDGERFARGRDALPRLNFLPRNKRVVYPELVEGVCDLKKSGCENAFAVRRATLSLKRVTYFYYPTKVVFFYFTWSAKIIL
jgi:hypothetical protein